MQSDNVIVIGAGVIGLSVALAAQSRGVRVQVIDRIGPAVLVTHSQAGGPLAVDDRSIGASSFPKIARKEG